MAERERPRVGVSACLLGRAVRYDGGHKQDPFVSASLAAHVELVPVCPEVEAGLGTPRPAAHLERAAAGVRFVETRSGIDHTERMLAHAAARVRGLADLDGYVLKKGSPSCGVSRVKGGERGLFAAALIDALPLLPVEEEGRLHDPGLREAFVERVFGHHRLRAFFAGAWTPRGLVELHAGEKMLLLAHDPVRYRELGRVVAGCAARPRAEVAARYRELYLGALARPATVRAHVNVLEHMAGHFKRLLDDADRRELHGAIAEYRQGHVPLVVPLGLLAHHARRAAIGWLLGQRYLAPHPRALGLRNHV
jgi:uncharacterized protein YbgA (DUF1722 family)/uncharacterized protein YbbK (DUF523 family)